MSTLCSSRTFEGVKISPMLAANAMIGFQLNQWLIQNRADGLGNPNENALPLCQIRRLKDNVQALHKVLDDSHTPFLFWMDTLCVPVHPESLRLIQIDKMASIYKGAISSLVLDAEIMSMPLDARLVTVGPVKALRLSAELRARPACSVWMSRSWCLQEGELPLSIAVQFRESAMLLGRMSREIGKYQEWSTSGDVSQPQNPVTSSETNVSARPAAEAGTDSLETLSRCDNDEQNTSLTSPELWNELAGRSTSKPCDVPMINTNILDFESLGFLRYHEAGDMFQAILLSLERIPLSIFFNTGLRQDPNGNHRNRWVPIEVGADTLASHLPLLKVHPSFVSLEYSDQGGADQISIYTVDTVTQLRSMMSLHSASEGLVFIADSHALGTDSLDTRGHTYSCIIVEKAATPDSRGGKRGAYFHV
ncbi:MAG: hypothetical protein Q9227_006080 [Pyrenula ochraceoflavens]